MKNEKSKGHDDQELLLRAYTTFVSSQINRSEQIVKGMIRQSISEWVDKNNLPLKDVTKLNETERLRVISEIIDIFLNKIKHIVESKFQRDKLKQNALQIYDQWKKTKRKDPSNDLISELEQLVDSD